MNAGGCTFGGDGSVLRFGGDMMDWNDCFCLDGDDCGEVNMAKGLIPLGAGIFERRD